MALNCVSSVIDVNNSVILLDSTKPCNAAIKGISFMNNTENVADITFKLTSSSNIIFKKELQGNEFQHQSVDIYVPADESITIESTQQVTVSLFFIEDPRENLIT